MRISKKFAGSSCIGKQVYQPMVSTADGIEEMKSAQVCKFFWSLLAQS